MAKRKWSVEEIDEYRRTHNSYFIYYNEDDANLFVPKASGMGIMTLPIKNVKKQMKKRSDEMPRDNVVVYCVSCIKAMHIGGRKPRYMIDLLFGEETGIGTFESDEWHNELQKFVDEH